MGQYNPEKLWVHAAAGLLGFLLHITPLHAEIFISELDKLDFATLEIPTGGQNQITIPADGSGYSGGGTVLIGTPKRGQYLITGGRQQSTITIDVPNVVTGSPYIQLDRFRGQYGNRKINNFPVGNLQDPGPSGRILYLGARLRYNRNVIEGTYSPSFDIEVIYE